MTKYLLLALFFLANSLSADWTTFGNNPEHTGHVETTFPTLNITSLWQKSKIAGDDGACIANGVVYYWDSNGLIAVSLISGDVLWKKFFPSGSFNQISYI